MDDLLPQPVPAAADRGLLCAVDRCLLPHDAGQLPGYECLALCVDDLLPQPVSAADRRMLQSEHGDVHGDRTVRLCATGHLAFRVDQLHAESMSTGGSLLCAVDRCLHVRDGGQLPGSECLAPGVDELRAQPVSAADRRVLHDLGHLHRDDAGGMHLAEYLERFGDDLQPQPVSAADRRVLRDVGHLLPDDGDMPLAEHLARRGNHLQPQPVSAADWRMLHDLGHLHRGDAVGVPLAEHLARRGDDLQPQPVSAADRRMLQSEHGDVHGDRTVRLCATGHLALRVDQLHAESMSTGGSLLQSGNRCVSADPGGGLPGPEDLARGVGYMRTKPVPAAGCML